MFRPLTLDQISQIINRHPEAFAMVSRQPVISVESVAYAISCMTVDPEVVASMIAASTGVLREDVPPGFMSMLQASFIAAQTLREHPHEDIAALFFEAVAPGFNAATGTVQ